MPLLNSMGILRNMGLNVSTISAWLSVIDLRLNGSTASTTYATQTGIVDSGVQTASTTRRPFSLQLNGGDGILSWYKVFSDLTTTTNTHAIKDSSGNTHIFVNTSNTVLSLYEYDSSNTYVKGADISGVWSSGTIIDTAYLIDSSDNLYVISYSGVDIYITKIDPATYTITWARTITINASRAPNTFSFQFDSAYNIIIGYSNSATTLGVVKYNPTSNSIVWSVGTTYGSITNKSIVIDSADDIYIGTEVTSPSVISKVVKLSGSTGAKVYEYNCSGINMRSLSIDTDTDNIYYNYLDGSSYSTLLMSSGASLVAIRTITQTRTSTSYDGQVTYVADNSAYLYGRLLNVSSGRRVAALVKIPKDLDFTTSTAYSFTLTSDNSTSYSYSGSIYISSATNPTLSTAINISIATISGVTIGTFSPSITSASPTSNSVTPYNYTIQLA